MELKKYVLAVSAVALTSFAFAANASQTQVILEQFKANPQQMVAAIQNPNDDELSFEEFVNEFFNSLPEMGITASTQQEKDTDAAIKAGLINFAKHATSGQLNEMEQGIQKAFETDIASILQEVNDMQQNVDPNMTMGQLQDKYQTLLTRFEKVLKDTANLVAKNQTEISADKVDQERAAIILQTFYMSMVYILAYSEIGMQ